MNEITSPEQYDLETTALKVPPHSIEAEQAVLGGLMLDNNAWERVSDSVSDGDFYRHDHRLIFRAIYKLAEANQPIDVVTLSEQLEKEGQLAQVGGLAYLGELAKNIPSVANIKAYAQIIRERATLRQLIGISNEIADSAFHPEGRGANEILDEAERKIFEIAEARPKTGGPVGISDILVKTIDRIDYLFNTTEALTGVSTGFTDLDEKTSGLQPADLIIVAGRPSMGKTTFAMNLVENAVMRTDKAVLVYSLEMPSDSIVMRMLSSLGRIDQTKVRSGKLDDEDWPRLTSAINLLNDKKLFIDDTAGISPSEMRADPSPGARARRPGADHDRLPATDADTRLQRRQPDQRDFRDFPLAEGPGEGIQLPGDCPVAAQPLPGAATQQAPGELRLARIRGDRAGRRRDHVRLPRRGVPPGDRVQGRRRNHHRQAA